MEWIRRHPYITGTLVLLLVVYFVIRARRSATSGTQVIQAGPSDAVQQAQVAAGAAVQQSQIQANAQTNALNAALAAKQLDSATQEQIAQFQRDVALQSIVTQGNVAQGQTNAQLQAAIAQVGGQVQIAGAESGAQVQIAGIQAGVSKAQIDANLKAILDQNATQISLADIASKTNISLADISSALQENLAQTDLSKSTQLATIDAAKAATLANIDYARQKDLATIAAGVTNLQTTTAGNVDLAKIAADLAATKDTNAAAIAVSGQQEATKQAGIAANAQVQTTAIQTEGSVEQSYIDAAKTLGLATVQTTQNTQQGVLDLLKSGALGDPNRAAVAAALLNQPAVGVAVAGNAAGNSPAAILSGVGNIVSSLFGHP